MFLFGFYNIYLFGFQFITRLYRQPMTGRQILFYLEFVLIRWQVYKYIGIPIRPDATPDSIDSIVPTLLLFSTLFKAVK